MNQAATRGAVSQRRFPRYVADMRVAANVFRAGKTISLWGRSTEVGEDGIGATMTGELEPLEVVSLELALPLSSQPMKLRAIVRYRQGLHHGFEFLRVSQEQRDTLRRVCEMLSAGR